MSNSLENACEQLSVLLLKANTDLTAIIPTGSIVRESEDSPADKDRIVCKASPKEVEMRGITPESVKIWRVPVDITLHFSTKNVASMDAALAEIAEATNTAPAGDALTIITDWNIRSMDDTDDGEFSTEDNVRKRTKRFNFLTEPVEEDLTGAFILEDGGHLLLES